MTSNRYCSFLALILLGVWVVWAAPGSIPAGDSGELTAAAWNLGIPHNPGYPLFVLLGKPILLIPLGSIAMRAALFSGLGLVLAATLFWVAILPRMVPGSRVFSSLGGLFLAAALMAGRYRTVAREGEVYGLTLAALTILLAFVVTWKNEPRRQALLGLAVGLAVVVHYQAAVVAVFLLIALIGESKKNRTPFPLSPVIILSLALPAVCLFLQLPLRSIADPLPDWGNSQWWPNFLYHLTGAEHRLIRVGGLAVQGRRILELAREVIAPWGWWIVLAPVGIASSRLSARWRLLAALMLAEGTYALFLNQVDPQITPFLLVTGMLVAGAVGIGAIEIASRITRFRPLQSLLVAVPLVVTVILPGYWDRDLPSPVDNYPQLWAERLIDSAPPRSAAVVSGDLITFPAAYLQGVGQQRPDITFLDQTNSVFRYPGWEPMKFDLETRRSLERQWLEKDPRPVVALGFLHPPRFGDRTAEVGGRMVKIFPGRQPEVLPSPAIPPAVSLIGLPGSMMSVRTVADAILFELGEDELLGSAETVILADLIRWAKDDPYVANGVAYRFFQTGSFQSAAAVLTAGIRRFPEVPQLISNLIFCQIAAGNLEEARETLSRYSSRLSRAHLLEDLEKRLSDSR